LRSTLESVAAQEDVMTVDDVVAQVNDDVITASMLKRRMEERIAAMKHRGMDERQAAGQGTRQAQLIVALIDEKLLLQRGKELAMAADIEVEVNRRMLQIAQEQGINSTEKLHESMRQSNLNPEEVRRTMQSELTKQAVLQQEVDRKVYLGFTAKEIKDYFDMHPAKFRKPESVKLSEIWLSTFGKDEASVRARALELIAEARAGADFGALAATNSERERNGQRTAPADRGHVGEFDLPNLRDDLRAVLNNVNAGGLTEPIKTGDGYQILRVDGRSPAGTTPTFNDDSVRRAMLEERQAREREAYVRNLRKGAFIKIADPYKASVEPLL
jgi:peptidyl-prolyl cis-trans isomerase SurA